MLVFFLGDWLKTMWQYNVRTVVIFLVVLIWKKKIPLKPVFTKIKLNRTDFQTHIYISWLLYIRRMLYLYSKTIVMPFSLCNFSLLSGISKIIWDCFLFFINGLLLSIHLWQGDSYLVCREALHDVFCVHLKRCGWRKASSLLCSNCLF